MRFSTSITIDGFNAITSIPPNSAAYGKANCIYCPLGPMPTQAWFVATKTVLDSLSINNSHTIVWKQLQAEDNSDDQTEKTLTFPGLYLVRAHRLLPGGVDDPSALFLLEFADARWLAGQSSRTGPVRSNLRSYANQADYLTGSNLDLYRTWQSLVQSLWVSCGFFGPYPGLPASLPLDGVPENTFLIGLNALRALTAVLEQLDCALRHDPLNNSYDIVQLGASQNLYFPNDILKFDGQPITVNSANAAVVSVHFFYHQKAYGQERDAELNDNAIVIDSSDLANVPTGIPGATGIITLWDDLPMVFDEFGVHTNPGAVATRAANRALRYAIRKTVIKQHKIMVGLSTNYIPAGQVRAVRWRNFGEGDNQLFHGTVTEYFAGPDLPPTSMGEGAWLDEQLVAPEREQYAGADWGRRTFPNYPRLSNIVQVQHTGNVQDGELVVADQVGFDGFRFHQGSVRRWRRGAMDVMDPCFILFADEFDSKRGDVPARQGFYYGPARLSGIATVSQTTLPIYVVVKGAEELIFVKVKVDNKTEGQLVQDSSGIFKAKIMQSPPNQVLEEIGDCYVIFVDYGDNGDIADSMVAENGRIYGPAKISTSVYNDKPIFEACIGEQEWDGKLDSPGATIEKGSSGNVELYNSDEMGSGIFIQAKAKYKKVKGDKWCIVKRLTRQLVVNQIEC
jgi:hypothetical protein